MNNGYAKKSAPSRKSRGLIKSGPQALFTSRCRSTSSISWVYIVIDSSICCAGAILGKGLFRSLTLVWDENKYLTILLSDSLSVLLHDS